MSAAPRTTAECRALMLELSRYLDGELPAARRRALERHLEACARCEDLEACLRRTMAACRAAGKTSLPPDVKKRAVDRVRKLLQSRRGNPRNPSAR